MENHGETPTAINNGARLAIMGLANMISVPMSLNAALHLNVPDAIWQNGSNTPLSASEILSRIFPSGGGDPESLQRILRLLASYGVFNEYIISGDAPQRRYSLTDIGKTLVTDENGLSFAPYVLHQHQKELMKAWAVVHEAVVDSSTSPFAKVNGGEMAYSLYGKKPELNELFQRAMSGLSVPFMKLVLEEYDGFKGVERLVDVGGSSGDCLRLILQKHSHIKEALNFDLPEVIAKAPKIAGVTHVVGDMFKSIPNCDAIFIKGVLTGWKDDEVKVILTNCLKAIPVGGKLIACEQVLPDHTDDSQRTRTLLEGDIHIMTIYRTKGRIKTENEYRQLGKSVGFTSFRAIYIDYLYTLLEFKK